MVENWRFIGRISTKKRCVPYSRKNQHKSDSLSGRERGGPRVSISEHCSISTNLLYYVPYDIRKFLVLQPVRVKLFTIATSIVRPAHSSTLRLRLFALSVLLSTDVAVHAEP